MLHKILKLTRNIIWKKIQWELKKNENGKNIEKAVNVWYRIWSKKESDLMAFDPENGLHLTKISWEDD